MHKIVVECRKEGTVNNLTPESLDQPTGTQKWEKCRLVLVKAVGGYMLEFYMPPRAAKVCIMMHHLFQMIFNTFPSVFFNFSHVAVFFVS